MLQLRSLSRRFGSFVALDQVDLDVAPGEIVALLGENGAGKHSLLNIVGGSLSPSSGSILWDGREIRLHTPRDATRLGIGVVHQHFMLVPVFTVAENLALQAGGESLYRARVWEERAAGWAASLGWKIDPRRRVEELSVGERQRVEILKALFARGGASAGQGLGDAARLLLLDKPTANLTPGEARDLFGVLRNLREQGRGIVFVSHKLGEVMELCDRVVVLRHGVVAGVRAIAETNVRELATLMVGSSPPPPAEPARQIGEPRLAISNLGAGMVRDLSLQVRSGEIVGLAGVDGNGGSDLLGALCGLLKITAGSFAVSPPPGLSPSLARDLAIIPPDRQHQGLVLSFDLAENLALHPALRASCRRRFGFDWPQARAKTRELMARFDVRAPAGRGRTAERSPAAQLSGGNQQKIVIARALSFGPRVLVASDPTRGLDIGATGFVHDQLRAAAAAGVAVLLVSTDLDEVLALSDRVGALYEGRLLPGPELLPRGDNRDRLGALMGGAVAAIAAGADS